MRIAVLYPELLGTYGDGGNSLVLQQRLKLRGMRATVQRVALGDQIPPADLYLLGGGEDGPQRLATDSLRRKGFMKTVRSGALVLAVCAGLQILGKSFAVEGDDEFEGLGLVDAVTVRGAERRVGNMAIESDGRLLVGFENHGGQTILGAEVQPLGTVLRGFGNDGQVDGYETEQIWATYAHGPVLALNPWFADHILSVVTGRELQPLRTIADDLHKSRLKAFGL
jgi:lipid II isoglutaminyl synthase (glutamine-hydrolysing)